MSVDNIMPISPTVWWLRKSEDGGYIIEYIIVDDVGCKYPILTAQKSPSTTSDYTHEEIEEISKWQISI